MKPKGSKAYKEACISPQLWRKYRKRKESCPRSGHVSNSTSKEIEEKGKTEKEFLPGAWDCTIDILVHCLSPPAVAKSAHLRRPHLAGKKNLSMIKIHKLWIFQWIKKCKGLFSILQFPLLFRSPPASSPRFLWIPTHHVTPAPGPS